MSSAWLDWMKARWQQRPGVPDYFIDADGTFHCEHKICTSLAEHEARNVARRLPPNLTA